jgi:hypothetical protein
LIESGSIDAALMILEQHVDNLIYEKLAQSSLQHARSLPHWSDNAVMFSSILSTYVTSK